MATQSPDTSSAATDLETLAVNTIRTLSMDAVEAAKSGHPGTPMALAPVAYQLWARHLRYDPEMPNWAGRDRFVLSCGHASMLLYSLLHLAGVKQLDSHGKPTGDLAVSLDQIKQFRQLHSRCPGHPENIETSGVETTTGPLGQGVANSVGMAIAEYWLAAHFNRPGYDLFGANVYALCSDGDLMEGISSEAASLAGHLKLANLCWIYDDNKITIEGETDLAFSENVATRFKGYGWNVISVADANDLGALDKAYKRFLTFRKKGQAPTLIIVRSHIGYGSPNKQDTHGAHGAPLGADEIRLTKQAYGWPADAQFLVPEEVTTHFAETLGKRGSRLRKAWQRKFKAYGKEFPELASQWQAIDRGELPESWDADIPEFPADAKGLATRVSGGQVLNAIAPRLPWLLGGSADLAPSTMTHLGFAGAGTFSAEDRGGRNFHFGIREHAMAAAINGMALSGLRPYGATFFVFTDYMRPSIRLAALMCLPVLHVLTHDSIGVGEDGPTHQPIEHLAAMRAIPRLIVMRPGDANEVAEAYRTLLNTNDRPACLVLSRQNLPTLDRSRYGAAAGTARGAYVLLGGSDEQLPEVILISTGSELAATLEAGEQLRATGVRARVVSMPSWELFEDQTADYRNEVLPPQVTARVAVEAGLRLGWDRYIGTTGQFVGLSDFGASAPAGVLMKHFGLTADAVVEAAREALRATRL